MDAVPGKLHTLSSAAAQHCAVVIHYCDRQGDETERTIVPFAGIKHNDDVYIHAWCERRGARRTFRLSDTEVLSVESTPRENWDAILSWAHAEVPFTSNAQQLF